MDTLSNFDSFDFMISVMIFPTHVTELLIVIKTEVFQLNIVLPNLPYNSWNFHSLDTLSNFDSFDFMIYLCDDFSNKCHRTLGCNHCRNILVHYSSAISSNNSWNFRSLVLQIKLKCECISQSCFA